MKVKLLLLITILLLISSGCAPSKNVVLNNEQYYKYTGELLGVVDQRKNDHSIKLGSLYTVTVDNASPALDQFSDYTSSNRTSEDFFSITDQTVIYRQIDEHRKQLIDPVELELNRGKQIEFWVRPMVDNHWNLEAIEISILDDVSVRNLSQKKLEAIFYEKNNTDRILKSFLVDFDLDGHDDLVVLCADDKNNVYSNIGVVSQGGSVSRLGLDASHEYRFVEPIYASISQNDANQPMLIVRLENQKEQKVVDFMLTMTRSEDKKSTGFTLSSKEVD